MPKSSHVHKSMLLRGVQPAPPALDRQDIESTKAKAAHSGRSFGGAPLRGNGNGRGRGGSHLNYSNGDNRPNPFAAHVNPGFAPPPPPNFQGRGGPPQGWVPPPPHYFSGQYNGYVPPQQGYNGPPPPLPHQANGYHGNNQGYGPPPPQDRRYSGR